MNRKFPYITVGQVIDQLNQHLRDEGLISDTQVAISRPSFYRLEKRIVDFPKGRRTKSLKPWRVFSQDEVDKIINIVKNEYWSR